MFFQTAIESWFICKAIDIEIKSTEYMTIWVTYTIIFAMLLVAELVYFRIADKCNIIDKPNERSSHSTIVQRGGGVSINGA